MRTPEEAFRVHAPGEMRIQSFIRFHTSAR